jgi:ABC-type glutathione transport system ATPase component
MCSSTGKPAPREVDTGITDGRVTGITGGDLKDGDNVIVSIAGQNPNQQRGGASAAVASAFSDAAAMANLIELRDLAKIYQSGDSEFAALHDVNLTIERGEFVAITGSSGSGKSTLMNILGCLDSPSRAVTCWRSRRGQAVAHRARARAQRDHRIRVPELQPAGAHLRVGERRAAADLRRVPPAERHRRARESLERVGLAHRAGHIPRSFPADSSSASPSPAPW